jgi:hypothetical protein
MDNYKKKYFDSKKNWKENLEVLWEEEESYKLLLVEKYTAYINQIKKDLIQYAKENNFEIVERNNFIEARYGDNDIIIRLNFHDIFPTDKYSFELIITEKIPREFVVLVVPSLNDLFIPKRSVSINRPKPENDIEAKRYTKELENEFINISNKKDLLKNISFNLYYHSSQHTPDNIKELKPHKYFIKILKELLSN